MIFDTLLLPTDGRNPAEAPATRGLTLTAQLDATVHVLSVADSGLATSVTYVGDSSRIRARLREQAAQHVEQLETEARDRGLDIETIVHEVIPAEEIVAYADEQNLDMIVMGTHGRGGFRRAVVGSVTDKLIRTANVPVLSVRTIGDASNDNEASR